jgi:transcriptional regulator with XRE-family HTH domain
MKVRGGEASLPVHLTERSRAIGAALRRARLRMKKSVREVARYLGTSPRRYGAIEAGSTYVGAPELEALVEFLEIPGNEVWPEQAEANRRQVIVEARPGESIQILVNVATEPEVEATNQLGLE